MRRTLRLVSVVGVLLCGREGLAQTPSSTGDALGNVSFEIASVKENHLSREEAGRPILVMHPAGDFRATWVTLRLLITTAYDVRPYQVVAAPEWAERDRFDVVAKAPVDLHQGYTKAMLRTLLEDRFRLVVKRERRRMPAYLLEWVDARRRPGPGIRPPSSQCDEVIPRASRIPPSRLPGNTGGAAGRDASRSECQPVAGFGIGWIFVRHGSLASFVGFLAREVGRPVIDRTGLAGDRDIDLKWSPEPSPELEEISGKALDDRGGISLVTAIREQLGMKLVPADHEVEVLVVERAERPTPN